MEVEVLCCAECNQPLVTTPGRGSYCLHCSYAPSMSDTYFRTMQSGSDVKVTEVQ